MKKLIQSWRAKKRLQMVGLGILTFSVLLSAATIVLAFLNVFFVQLDAYSITLIVVAVFAAIHSAVLMILFYTNAQKAQLLVDNFEKVAAGDFSAEIEYGKGNSFAKVYKNFNQMTRELNSVRTMREDFVHNFSHEIKTPLFSIHGFATLLLEGGLTEEEQKKFLQIIADESDRLFRLADSALTLSKLENQHMSEDAKPLRLDLEINDCIILLEREWEKKKIEISSDLAPVKIVGDGAMLRQVWLNLLSNAVKFSHEGGKVEVTLRRAGGNAVVSVKDEGCGISPQDMPRIFDKYYRSESAASVDGNGLGLAICKRICTIVGGDISAVSDDGGTVFTVTLPIS